MAENELDPTGHGTGQEAIPSREVVVDRMHTAILAIIGTACACFLGVVAALWTVEAFGAQSSYQDALLTRALYEDLSDEEFEDLDDAVARISAMIEPGDPAITDADVTWITERALSEEVPADPRLFIIAGIGKFGKRLGDGLTVEQFDKLADTLLWIIALSPDAKAAKAASVVSAQLGLENTQGFVQAILVLENRTSPETEVDQPDEANVGLGNNDRSDALVHGGD